MVYDFGLQSSVGSLTAVRLPTVFSRCVGSLTTVSGAPLVALCGLLIALAFRVVERGCAGSFSSCGLHTWLPHGM